MKKIAVAAVVMIALAAILAWANWPETPIPSGTTADRLLVLKSKRHLLLYSRGQLVKTYAVALGPHPSGKKQREGDGRTPEGMYVIDYRKQDSCCFRSLHISYPNPRDRAFASAQHADPGGLIMIHGISRGFGWVGRLHRLHDWTNGCVAVTNREMAELWRAVPAGTPIEVEP